MKKSKFLQSSKDLLSRSFNSSKCKTALKLAGSRVKLLRNKKEAQLKHMRREIAQLLVSGDDRTARIRVEHVIREEKMMAAYDLIELYCELIVTRLPIIETQKTCPIDLKEAISSLAFASPRCGDVPELLDAKKQFTMKYGKEFIEKAIELRPACGVSSLLVEKLSAAAPDIQTKLKVLKGIAEEHNVNWDFVEEKDTLPSELLKGPSTPKKEKEVFVETSHYESGSPHCKAPLSNYRSGSQLNIPARQTSGVSITYQSKESPRGDERSHGERQKWNMEFKDATSAAQAAAECAEQASMAARAAAILSTRESMSRQYSSESNKSDGYDSKFSSSRVSRKNSLEGEDPRDEINTKKSSFKYEANHSENHNSRYGTSVVFDKSDSDKSDGYDSKFSSSQVSRKNSLEGEDTRDEINTKKSSSLEGEDTRDEINTKKSSFKYEANNSETHNSRYGTSVVFDKSDSEGGVENFKPVIFDDSDGPASGSDGSSEKYSPKSGLNFGNLRGGFRHKPTYLNNPLAGSSSLHKESLRPVIPPSPKRTTMLGPMKSIRKPEVQSDSDSDSSEEGGYYSSYKQNTYKNKLSIRASNQIFGSDSDFDDNIPQESPSRQKPLLIGTSRRTKASPTGTGAKLNVRNLNWNNQSETHDQHTAPYDSKFLNKEESPRKTSHVHPKMPEYDSFVKSFQHRRS